MARKKWRIQRPMLVPAQWEGSVEHFYHFFLGYFVPMVRWQETTGRTDFAIRDCGPMNPWFDLLRPNTDLDILAPGVMLQRYMSKRQMAVVLHDWDNPTKFHQRTLHGVRKVVTERVGATRGTDDGPRITVLDRLPGPSFFEGSASEVYSSGSAFRSIPNMPEVADGLTALGRVSLVDTASMHPADQVRMLADTDLLVAQHGAGLANMTWMVPGTSVLEILPPLPPTIDTIFRNLAAALGLAYANSPQEELHTQVNVTAIRDLAHALLTDPKRWRPTPTGHVILRRLHQLPRRF